MENTYRHVSCTKGRCGFSKTGHRLPRGKRHPEIPSRQTYACGTDHKTCKVQDEGEFRTGETEEEKVISKFDSSPLLLDLYPNLTSCFFHFHFILWLSQSNRLTLNPVFQ